MSDKLNNLSEAIDFITANDLDSAHRIAQRYEGDSTADALHAIIHRREGDFSNSIYWWRRVGAAVPASLTAVYGDPSEFTKAVRDQKHTGDLIEIELLELAAMREHLQTVIAGQPE